MKSGNKENSHFLSVVGFCYILGSSLFLTSGILRGELVSTICGTAFLSFALFSIFHVILTFLFWKEASFSATWTSENTIAISICKEKPLYRLHFLFSSEILCTINYETSPGDQQTHHFLLLLPVTEILTVHHISLPSRGYYHNTSSSIRIRDFSHFFTISIKQEQTDILSPLVVFPIPETPSKLKLPQKPFGITRGKSTFRRSEDLYETRAYAPGDDPRKINWKVYAHMGELSIRQGELLPPPADEYIFIINSSITISPQNKHKLWFDILINRITYVALYLISQKKTVSFFITNEKRTFEKMTTSLQVLDAKDTLLAFLTLPQLTQTDISLVPILSTLPRDASLILCTLPFYSFNPAILKAYSQNLVIYLGPVLEQQLPVTFLKRFKTFVFIQKPNTVCIGSEELNEMLFQETEKLTKGGFNVTKM